MKAITQILDYYRIPHNPRMVDVLLNKYLRLLIASKKRISKTEQEDFRELLKVGTHETDSNISGLDKITVVYGSRTFKFTKDDQVMGIFNDAIEGIRAGSYTFHNEEHHALKPKIERLYSFLTRHVESSGITIIAGKKRNAPPGSTSKSQIKRATYDLLSAAFPDAFLPSPPKEKGKFNPGKFKVSKINSYLR